MKKLIFFLSVRTSSSGIDLPASRPLTFILKVYGVHVANQLGPVLSFSYFLTCWISNHVTGVVVLDNIQLLALLVSHLQRLGLQLATTILVPL